MNRLTKTANCILALQPLFAAPVYFSVLTGYPLLWISIPVAIFPLVIRYLTTRQLITRTPFDLPILLFMVGTIIGVAVAPDKEVATGAFWTTLASVLMYYGIASNAHGGKKYWIWTGGIICGITLSLSLWFLSQSSHRVFSFNQWAFDLFAWLPKTPGPVMQQHTIGALLAVVIPPLVAMVLFNKRDKLRNLALIFGLFFSIMLLLSDSGTGWIACVAGVIPIMFIRSIRLGSIFTSLVGIAAAVFAFMYNKLEWIYATFSTDSLMGRVELWRNSPQLLDWQTALTGLGLGSWRGIYNDYFVTNHTHLHNSYVQAYYDTGIPGVIAMILAAVIFVRLTVKLLKSSKENPIYGLGIGLTGSIVAGAAFSVLDTTHTVTDVMQDGYIYMGIPLLWIFAALLSVVYERLQEKH